MQLTKVNWKLKVNWKNFQEICCKIFPIDLVVVESSFGLCSRAPGSIKGSGAQKQRPQELLATL